MRPGNMSAEAWEPVFANLAIQTGTTWGDYVRKLSENATYLQRLGEQVNDIRELLSFETMQASGLTATQTLASEVDALLQAPGLSLSLAKRTGP